MGLLLLLVPAGGCRLDLDVEVDVARGGGRLAVRAGLDRELLEHLDELGVDPTAELGAAVASTDGWELVRSADEDGLTVALVREVQRPSELGEELRALTDGLAEADPALLVDLDVRVADDGTADVSGTARLRPPATAGARLDGREIGPDAGRLASLTDRDVDARLTVRMPGGLVEAPGAGRDGGEATWRLPVDEAVTIRAVARPVAWWREPRTAWIAGAAGVVVLGAVGWWWRRRAAIRPGA